MTINNAQHLVVEHTKQWLAQVIIGFNFCPFAKKEFVNNTIHYHVSVQKKLKDALLELIEQCVYIENNTHIETGLIIFQQGFKNFEQYLDLVDYANELLVEQNFEGVFQLASFHPDYCFADCDFDDAANFTNRSPYPTLHIIREASMEKVLSVYKNPEQIPEDNIALAQQKGGDYFKQILMSIKNTGEN
ncbi:MAG: hypothetical protein COB35_10450 [Gammaproteobacteria bacterium]|nr:MAG: hypothetical protein COB35_10450 [Gammaproteobacteria bacterium]